MNCPTTLASGAAWCWFSDPRAVRQRGVRDLLHAGFIRPNGDVAIATHDLDSGATEEVTLHPALEVDDHDVPSILLLPDGRLLAFYTEHNGRGFSRRSSGPGGAGGWEPERPLPFGDKITYSNPVLLPDEDDRILLFWRGLDWRVSMSSSDDLGETWREPVAVIDSTGERNRPYLKIAADGAGRVDLVFTDGHPGREPTNSLYHLSYSGETFRRTDGTVLGSIEELPLDRRLIEPCYDARRTGVRAWVFDLALDPDGHPVIAYARYPDTTDHRYHYLRWDGRAWRDEELCAAGGTITRIADGEPVREPHYSGGLSLDHSDPNRLALSRERGGVFEVETWTRRPGGWRVEPVTEASESDQLRPYIISGPGITDPGRPAAIVGWLSGRYRHYTDFDTDLMISRL